ncbi:MAG: glycosyltransferase family 4 protein [Chloroflexi bacterium]|nr:glycosyltransferase family 4 protein [Chloroflexota bacterium]
MENVLIGTESQQLEFKVGWMSTFLPRRCGLATFTGDLVAAVRSSHPNSTHVVAALEEPGASYSYGPAVKITVTEGNVKSYIAAGRALTKEHGVDIVSLQHDFGRFGIWNNGFEADFAVPLLKSLSVPAVVTLHSVQPEPNELMRQTVQGMAEHAAAMVVMAQVAKRYLQRDYGLSSRLMERVIFIPHGVPYVGPATMAERTAAQDALGVAGCRVISTFGLLGEGKGIEDVIHALPALVERHPDLLYLVIGQTHPEVRRLRGESYRESLIALAQQLGVREHIRFINRFLTQDEIIQALIATDVYATPYPGRHQIVSGTLAYALACGCAVISTPFLYAEELLADGRGLLVEFHNPDSLASAIDTVLSSPVLQRQLTRRATAFARSMHWPQVGTTYANLFKILTANYVPPLWPARPTAPAAAHPLATALP